MINTLKKIDKCSVCGSKRVKWLHIIEDLNATKIRYLCVNCAKRIKIG